MDEYNRTGEVEEGSVYNLKVDAKGARGEAIGRIGDIVVFVKNSKTRLGNMYNVKITKVYRTFAYAELKDSKHQFVGNGSVII